MSYIDMINVYKSAILLGKKVKIHFLLMKLYGKGIVKYQNTGSYNQFQSSVMYSFYLPKKRCNNKKKLREVTLNLVMKFIAISSHHHIVPSAQISLTLFATLLYHPLLLVGLQGYILPRHRAVVCGYRWSSCLCSSMWRGPQEYVTYEFVPISPAVSRMSGSSNLDSFCDGW